MAYGFDVHVFNVSDLVATPLWPAAPHDGYEIQLHTFDMK